MEARRSGSAWFPGDNLNMAIGQGYALITPLQLAVGTATIANRGKRMRPQVVRSVGGVERPPVVADYLEVDDKHWDFIQSAMENTVHSSRGTARRIGAGADYRMGGKPVQPRWWPLLRASSMTPKPCTSGTGTTPCLWAMRRPMIPKSRWR